MATTAGGLPYVEPSDLVSGWPAVSQSLAEELDSQLAAKAALAGATYTGTHDFTGATVTGISSGGLVLVTAQSFTTASAVNVNNCFTSTYTNYLMTYNITSASTTMSLTWRLRVSGTDNSTASSYLTNLFGSSSANAANNSYIADTNFYAGPASASGAYSNGTVTLMSPAIAQVTTVLGHYTGHDGTDTVYRTSLGHHTQNTAYDGFSLITSTGTITGTVRVYGYKNS